MFSIIDKNKLKEYILSNIPQEQVFAHYLDVPIEDIYYCLQNKNNRISNPLRIDNDPSLGFMYSQYRSDKLNMKDFANAYYNGDCFSVAGIVMGLNCNNNKDFIKICYDIINKIPHNIIGIYTYRKKEKQIVEEEIKSLETINRGWTEEDIKYWNKYTISIWFLEQEGVNPVYKAWYNNVLIYINKDTEPCYIYRLFAAHIFLPLKGNVYVANTQNSNITLAKLYLPFSEAKFRTNIKAKLEDNKPLVPNDVLIICKSTKDKILLRWFKYLINISPKYKHIRVDNIEVTSFTSESVVLSPHEANELKGMYKKIFIFNDFDPAGISCTYKHLTYGFIPIFLKKINVHLKMFEALTNKFNNCNYKGKDISDYTYENGIQNTLRLITNFINRVI